MQGITILIDSVLITATLSWKFCQTNNEYCQFFKALPASHSVILEFLSFIVSIDPLAWRISKVPFLYADPSRK
jgi:hypothetical protein